MNGYGRRWGWGFALIVISLLLLPGQARAHRDDYLDETSVFLTLGQDEVETEYWLDYGFDREASAHFFRHHAAVEWGITDHWMVDGRVTLKKVVHAGTIFDGGRLETRYRFGEENEHFLDLAVSTELNWERNEDGDLVGGLEPRLILSKDFHEKLNFTLNLSEEFPFDSGKPAFLLYGGIRYNWTHLVRVGVEWHHDSGAGEGSVIPQVWFALPRGVTIKAGYSAGYAANQEDFTRLALEAEF